MTDTTRQQPLRWSAAAITHRGAVRAHNEDALYTGDHQQIWLVADGMGGHQRGDFASQTCAAALADLPAHLNLSDTLDVLEDALVGAHQQVRDFGRDTLGGGTVGCTLVTLVMRSHVGLVCWAGDSRLYRLRNGQLRAMTRDHSRLQDLVDRGLLSPSQLTDHPEANVITRALGVEQQLALDMTLFSGQLGDSFLLCSDGLYNALSQDEIIKHLSNPQSDTACRTLVDAALAHQAKDNVTAIVVRALPASAIPEERAHAN